MLQNIGLLGRAQESEKNLGRSNAIWGKPSKWGLGLSLVGDVAQLLRVQELDAPSVGGYQPLAGKGGERADGVAGGHVGQGGHVFPAE